MKTKNIQKLLTIEEKEQILKCLELLTEEEKIYLSVIEKETNIPSFVIKEYLKTKYKEEYLYKKIHGYSCNYFSVYKNSYALFQRFINAKSVKRQYVHTWIVSKILGIEYKEFVEMDLVAHHINLDKLDNRAINLIPMPKGLHMQFHKALEKKEDLDVFWYIDEYCVNKEYFQLLGYYMGKIESLQ